LLNKNYFFLGKDPFCGIFEGGLNDRSARFLLDPSLAVSPNNLEIMLMKNLGLIIDKFAPISV